MRSKLLWAWASASMGRVCVARVAQLVEPLANSRRHLRPGRRGHPAREGVDVVLTKAARRLAVRRVRVGSDVPDGPERRGVDLADLGDGEELAIAPGSRLERLAVDPLRGGGVALDLHVLLELLVADGNAVGQEPLDLLEHERVALDRRGVMRLLVPDRRPDALGLHRVREATHPVAQLGERHVEAVVDRLS